MSKTTEALKLAKKALERSTPLHLSQINLDRNMEAMTAIREALAEQEKLVPKVSHGLCGGCAKTAANGWALYCVECWEKAEPVKQEPVAIGDEWKPCMKLPIVVHVREQREGETHVSTREGITPILPTDLIMRGVDGEEYPIGYELFNKTYTFEIAAPVDAKAIRAEALKEAEEIAKTIGGSFADEFLAATRELK